MKRILVVEDEPGVALGLEDDLRLEGYAVTVAVTASAALDQLESSSFDLLLLDVSLPDGDGYSVCRTIRGHGDETPVIFLTARDGEAEKVLGLELGADDYVTKPFSPLELRARIRAVLRRRDGGAGQPVRVGPLSIDPSAVEASLGEARLGLTPNEFRILARLAEAPGEAVPRTALLESVWGHDTYVTERVLDTHVGNLRAKLRPHGREALIETIRGVGFRLRHE